MKKSVQIVSIIMVFLATNFLFAQNRDSTILRQNESINSVDIFLQIGVGTAGGIIDSNLNADVFSYLQLFLPPIVTTLSLNLFNRKENIKFFFTSRKNLSLNSNTYTLNLQYNF